MNRATCCVQITTDSVHAGLCTHLQKQMCDDPQHCQWMNQWQSRRSVVAEHGNDGQQHRSHEDAVAALHRMSWGEVKEVLRKYCLSVAAKDCSIIVSYSVLEGEADSTAEVLQTPVMDCLACAHDAARFRDMLCSWNKQLGTDHSAEVPFHCCVGSMRVGPDLVRYRMGVVDMDRKSIMKVQRHHELDQEISQAWNALENRQPFLNVAV
jgi:hypothetical protein